MRIFLYERYLILSNFPYLEYPFKATRVSHCVKLLAFIKITGLTLGVFSFKKPVSFQSVAITIWTFASTELTGIYIELAFLNGFLLYGQGLIILACFISDYADIFKPLIKYYRLLRYGENVLKLPNIEELDEDTLHTCEQFETYHLLNCKQGIARDRRYVYFRLIYCPIIMTISLNPSSRYEMQIYRNVFYGHEFVDWLLKIGLAQDRASAVSYGTQLVNGRVMEHINNIYNFNDGKMLFKFTSGSVRI